MTVIGSAILDAKLENKGTDASGNVKLAVAIIFDSFDVIGCWLVLEGKDHRILQKERN